MMALRTFRSLARLVDAYARLLCLSLLNRFGRAPIIRPGGPIVSLTTYGKRSKTVHLTIESIGRGRLRPSRLLLWIDEPHLAAHLTGGLRRLQRRGLEVKECANLGPHKKYYPYLESSDALSAPLVTADDDILYPRTWLHKLVEEFHKHPKVVNCYRARIMSLDQRGISTYLQWRLTRSTAATFRHFAGSGAGVIFPVRLQLVLKREGLGFLTRCPEADDIWLHVQAIRAGYKIRQIDEREFRLIYIPGTQDVGLRTSNMSGGNDRQVKTTYTDSDLQILRHEVECCATGEPPLSGKLIR